MPPDALRLVIADDEPHARGLLRRYVSEDAGLRLLRECATSSEVADALDAGDGDLFVLDVRMPGPDIFDVLAQAATVRRLPAIIFSTAFDSYAVRAFDVNAVDYLVKPFTAARFSEAIRRARDRAASADTHLRRLLRDLGSSPDRLLVPEGRRMVPLAVGDILWIKAEGDYARVFARDHKSYLISRTLKDLEARLDRSQFVRIHRSAMVHTAHIKEVRAQGSSRYRVTLDDGTTVVVSRTHASELKRWML